MSRARTPEPVVEQEERTFAVDCMSRVEGEGRLKVVVRGSEVLSAELSIFEAPRFFERLVVGREPDEVLDIVARICGICPVAYQMTAVGGLRAPLRGRARPAGAAAAPPLLLGRVATEPCPAYLPAQRARLPGLRQRHRHGSRPPRHRRARAGPEAGRRGPAEAGRWPRRASGEHARGWLLPRTQPRPGASAAAGRWSRPWPMPRRRSSWTAAFDLPDFERDPLMLSMHDPELYALDTGRLITTEGIEIDPGRRGTRSSRSSTSSTPRPCRRRASMASITCWARRHAWCWPVERCIRWPRPRSRKPAARRCCGATCSRPSPHAVSR